LPGSDDIETSDNPIIDDIDNIDFTVEYVSPGSISGTAKDANGNGGVTVHLYYNDTTNDVFPPVVSDGSGYYEFPSVSAGTYDMVAEKTGFDPDSEDNVTVTTGVGITVNFTVTTPTGHGDVIGTVVNGDSNPVEGAVVNVGGKTDNTGPDGTFHVVDAPSGNQTLTVTKTGYETYTDTILVPTDDTVDVGTITLIKQASVSGTIDDDEDGNLDDQNIIVIAYRIDSSGEIINEGQGMVDASGNYEIEGIPGGYTYHITAIDTNYDDGSVYISKAKEVYVALGEFKTGQNVTLSKGEKRTINLYDNPNNGDTDWNLISFPVRIDETVPLPAILYHLDGGDWTRLAIYNAEDKAFEYYGSGDYDFQYFKINWGIWITVDDDCTLTVAGREDNTSRTFQVYDGWNIIGLPFTQSKTKSDLSLNEGNISYGWMYDNQNKEWILFDPHNYYSYPRETTTLDPGYGYYLLLSGISNTATLTIQ
jgi:hypothetical protein